VLQPSGRGEPRLAHNVVMDIVDGLDGKGHVVLMDNYFSSVGLFTRVVTRMITNGRTMAAASSVT
jgi:hypothetical protein